MNTAHPPVPPPSQPAGRLELAVDAHLEEDLEPGQR